MTLSRDLMFGMLRRGNTGEELMNILNLIVSENQSSNEVENENEAELVTA